MAHHGPRPPGAGLDRREHGARPSSAAWHLRGGPGRSTRKGGRAPQQELPTGSSVLGGTASPILLARCRVGVRACKGKLSSLRWQGQGCARCRTHPGTHLEKGWRPRMDPSTAHVAAGRAAGDSTAARWPCSLASLGSSPCGATPFPYEPLFANRDLSKTQRPRAAGAGDGDEQGEQRLSTGFSPRDTGMQIFKHFSYPGWRLTFRTRTGRLGHRSLPAAGRSEHQQREHPPELRCALRYSAQHTTGPRTPGAVRQGSVVVSVCQRQLSTSWVRNKFGSSGCTILI